MTRKVLVMVIPGDQEIAGVQPIAMAAHGSLYALQINERHGSVSVWLRLKLVDDGFKPSLDFVTL